MVWPKVIRTIEDEKLFGMKVEQYVDEVLVAPNELELILLVNRQNGFLPLQVT
jgi:hypothetical protein